MSSNFQIMFSDIPPRQNCHCQEERSLLIYVVNESPFKTDGRIRSNFQMKCSDIPPATYQVKWLRWDVRWRTQIGCWIYPPQLVRWSDQDEMWDEVPIWAVRYTPHNLSDDVTKMRCEMKYPCKLSDCYWHLMVKNGNSTLLLTSSGQEWQFHIATDISWSRMAISHCYWHLVVNNSNFTLLLTSSGQEWQVHIATDI